jgi:N-acetylmuramoyl-L-alanine amidase
MAMKFGIVVGHTRTAPGASGHSLPSEYFYNSVVAADMKAYAIGLGIGAEIFFRDTIGVVGAYRQADDWGADLTAELHYNSYSDASVRGTETLSSGTTGSLRFAREAQAAMCQALARNGNSRGVKIRNRQTKGRGWLSLVSGRAPAILTEPAFASNFADAALLQTHNLAIGRAIVDAARRAANTQ